MNHDMSLSALENGPDLDGHLMVCNGCGGTGQAYMGRLASKPGPCRDCAGEGEVLVDLDDIEDDRDPDADDHEDPPGGEW